MEDNGRRKKNITDRNRQIHNHDYYGETFTLSDDRTKLLPSFGSLRNLYTEEPKKYRPEDEPHPQRHLQQNNLQPPAIDRNKSTGSGRIFSPLVTIDTDKSDVNDGEDNSDKEGDCHVNDSKHGYKYMKLRNERDDRSSVSTPVDRHSHSHRIGRKGKRRNRFLRYPSITILAYIVVLFFTLVILIVPTLLHRKLHKSQWCHIYKDHNDSNCQDSSNSSQISQNNCTDTAISDNYNLESLTFPSKTAEYENPDFDTDPCRYLRLPLLVYLTLEEADHCRRLLASVLMGFAIGYERRISDRPAGIRTMGLVSLGSCFFTISSITAFRSSTMCWDASRVSAAIPSGVGFLGAGLIWKGNVGEGKDANHQVHGLTTAASVWLSAAAGVGAGGRLYFVSAYSTILVMIILRYGPTIQAHYLDNIDKYVDDSYEEDDLSSEGDLDKSGGESRCNASKNSNVRRHLENINDQQCHSNQLYHRTGGNEVRTGMQDDVSGSGSFDQSNMTPKKKITKLGDPQSCSSTGNYYKMDAAEMAMFQRWKDNEMAQDWINNIESASNHTICGDSSSGVGIEVITGARKNGRAKQYELNDNDENGSNHNSNRDNQSIAEGTSIVKEVLKASSGIDSAPLETEVPIHNFDDGKSTSFYSSDPSSFASTFSNESGLSYENKQKPF